MVKVAAQQRNDSIESRGNNYTDEVAKGITGYEIKKMMILRAEEGQIESCTLEDIKGKQETAGPHKLFGKDMEQNLAKQGCGEITWEKPLSV